MAEVVAMRNNALPYPVYGLAFTVTFPLLDADGDPISPSSPDSQISKNGDTYAACTNEAVEIATTSGTCYLTLTASELTADVVTIRILSTGAKTTVITLYPRKLPVLATGTCQGSNDTGDIQLASGDSAIDDFYNGCLIVAVIDGTTEARVINDYVGSTKVAEIAPAWNTAAPDSDDTYTIYLPEGRSVQPSTLINGPHGGTSTVFIFERFVGASTTTNEPAMKLTGNGTAAGFSTIGGTTGPGAKFTGGATSGSGIHSSAPTSGYGIYALALGDNGSGIHAQGFGDGSGMLLYGGTNGDGLACQGYKAGGGIVAHGGADGGAGAGAGPGMFANASATGPGMQISGGPTATTTGHGLVINGDFGDAIGIYIRGAGAYPAIHAAGGATGHGLDIRGGGTSGDGINISTTSGHGVKILPLGTNKHGISLSGGNAGTCHALLLTSGTGGQGFRSDTLNISGTVTMTDASNDIRGIDVKKLDTDATALARLRQMFAVTRLITVDDATFSPTTTSFETDQTTDAAGRYTEQVLYGLSGNNACVTVPITGYAFTNSKVKLTVEALPTTPADNDQFLIMGRIEQ
jgi:hypothetical protein